MHASFLVAGVLFLLQILPSHPMKPARGPVWQGGAILMTNVIMTVSGDVDEHHDQHELVPRLRTCSRA